MGRGSRTLTQALLATTCLTVASLGPAHASLVAESSDFPDAVPGTLLAPGVNQVTGATPATATSADQGDAFTFTGLPASQPFTITYDETDPSSVIKIELYSYPPETLLGSRTNDGTLQGSVPSNGNLTVWIRNFEGGDAAYSVTLDVKQPTAMPAPSTLTLSAVGAAVAGALGWRRRRTHGRAAG